MQPLNSNSRRQSQSQTQSCSCSVVLFATMVVMCVLFFAAGIYTSHSQLTEDYTNKM
jgi:hypothetical protein